MPRARRSTPRAAEARRHRSHGGKGGELLFLVHGALLIRAAAIFRG